MVDPRAQRTRSALHSAVIRLASQQPVAELSVTTVARTAGISRDTFYRYAPDPVTLLASALEHEVAAAIAALPANVTVGAAERVVLTHVQRRSAVYRGAMQPALAAPIREALERLIAEGLLAWIALGRSVVPRRLIDDPLGQRMAARYAAAGTLGAIEEWLDADETEIDAGVERILAASPSWWLT